MPDIRKVRRRIKGVQNIAKITRAMEMIAASKMKKAQERGLAGRPYAEKIEQVINHRSIAPMALLVGSNLTPEELSAALASRFSDAQICRRCCVKAPDFRPLRGKRDG